MLARKPRSPAGSTDSRLETSEVASRFMVAYSSSGSIGDRIPGVLRHDWKRMRTVALRRRLMQNARRNAAGGRRIWEVLWARPLARERKTVQSHAESRNVH